MYIHYDHPVGIVTLRLGCGTAEALVTSQVSRDLLRATIPNGHYPHRLIQAFC